SQSGVGRAMRSVERSGGREFNLPEGRFVAKSCRRVGEPAWRSSVSTTAAALWECRASKRSHCASPAAPLRSGRFLESFLNLVGHGVGLGVLSYFPACFWSQRMYLTI